jgi:hypothetical protein
MGFAMVAYQLQEQRGGFDLTVAAPQRQWMDETHQRSAYRCLPLLMANQSGWLILNNSNVRFKWDGGPGMDAVTIHGDGYPLPAGAAGVMSHFGSGIVTWTIPFLFRTPTGYNMWVKGPANYFKDGAAPLEAVVETDWAVATFTMNWKITRPHHWVAFDKGDPFCMIIPQRRGERENFQPEIQPIYNNPELSQQIDRWQTSRGEFNQELKIPGSDAEKRGWEKDYLQNGHQTRLHLQPFTDHVPKESR